MQWLGKDWSRGKLLDRLVSFKVRSGPLTMNIGPIRSVCREPESVVQLINFAKLEHLKLI